MGRKQGTPTGSVEYSPAKRKRMKQQRDAQERKWAALAGPVTVRKAVPPCDFRGCTVDSVGYVDARLPGREWVPFAFCSEHAEPLVQALWDDGLEVPTDPRT